MNIDTILQGSGTDLVLDHGQLTWRTFGTGFLGRLWRAIVKTFNPNASTVRVATAALAVLKEAAGDSRQPALVQKLSPLLKEAIKKRAFAPVQAVFLRSYKGLEDNPSTRLLLQPWLEVEEGHAALIDSILDIHKLENKSYDDRV